jgi:arsenate reductase
MDKRRVLFVCVHNSARSQMAEAYLKEFAGDRFEAESGGFEPGTLNPLVVEVMKEDGIDISGNRTKAVFDFIKKGTLFSYIIAVCDEASAQRCPTFPGGGKRITWSFEDPAAFSGSQEEKLTKTRAVRDGIRAKVVEWLKEVG